MWSIAGAPLDARTLRCEVLRDGRRAAARGDVMGALASDRDLRARLTESLAGSPFAAFFWEVAPLSRERTDAPFEYVLVDAPRLGQGAADPEAFREHWSGAQVVSFANLSGDARLVVPCPVAPPDAYAHLAAFVRKGPPEQVDALWAEVGRAAAAWRAEREDTLWLSTSGLAVAWLHVRLDARPKYYSHAPYRDPAA
jgi:hypothetical protein